MFGHQDDDDTLNNQADLVQQPTTVMSSDDSTDSSTQDTSDGAQADDDSASTGFSRPSLPTTSAPLTAVDNNTDNSKQSPDDSSPVDELIAIKQQVLANLTPIIDHIDQTPEEKFNTTMMMIQASDNPSLIKKAYDAANQIEDEKIKAQALLDIVNEINYFTHPTA